VIFTFFARFSPVRALRNGHETHDFAPCAAMIGNYNTCHKDAPAETWSPETRQSFLDHIAKGMSSPPSA